MPRFSGNALNKDGVTNASVAIRQEHHEIHEGEHFYISGFESEDTAGIIEFLVTTPDSTKWTHLTFSVVGIENITMEVFKGPTGIVGGTPVTPINNNGNSAEVSVDTVIKDPTSIADDGTLIDSYSVGATGATPASTGNVGIADRTKELILKQNETYLFRITSGADSNIISYNGSWYEHVNKE